MKPQYINDKPYKNYISLYCDNNLRNELIEALDIIWQHPDGKENIMQSYNIRGKLDLICDAIVHTGYGSPEDLESSTGNAKNQRIGHKIHINTNETLTLIGDKGQYFEPSILGILAHELYHASDF